MEVILELTVPKDFEELLKDYQTDTEIGPLIRAHVGLTRWLREF